MRFALPLGLGIALYDYAASFSLIIGIIAILLFAVSRFKKDNYELFDITLDKKHVSNNSETKEQKFTELFYQSTDALVHDKLNM